MVSSTANLDLISSLLLFPYSPCERKLSKKIIGWILFDYSKQMHDTCWKNDITDYPILFSKSNNTNLSYSHKPSSYEISFIYLKEISFLQRDPKRNKAKYSLYIIPEIRLWTLRTSSFCFLQDKDKAAFLVRPDQILKIRNTLNDYQSW